MKRTNLIKPLILMSALLLCTVLSAQENPFDKGLKQEKIKESKQLYIAPLYGMYYCLTNNYDYDVRSQSFGANLTWVKDKHKRTVQYIVGVQYAKYEYKGSGEEYDRYRPNLLPREQLAIPLLIRLNKFAELGVSYNAILNASDLNAQATPIEYKSDYFKGFIGFGGLLVPIGTTGGGIVCQFHMDFNLSKTGDYYTNSLKGKGGAKPDGKFNDGLSYGLSLSYDIPIK